MAKFRQYNNLVVVPPASSTNNWNESPHVDAFQNQTLNTAPQANWKKAAIVGAFIATIPFFFIDAKQLTLRENVQVDKFGPQIPARILLDRPRTQYLYPSTETRVDLPLNQTQRPMVYYPDKIFDVKRQQYLYPSEFRTDVVVKVFQISNSIPDAIFKSKELRYTYPSFFIDPKVLTQPERVQYDKFQPQYPNKIYDVARNQFLYPTFSFYPVPLNKIPFIDSWGGYHPDKVYDFTRNQFLYPNYFSVWPIANIYPIFNQSIGVNYPIRYQYQKWATDPKSLLLKENITMDKWYVETAKPVWDFKRQQYTYPFLSLYLGQISQIEGSIGETTVNINYPVLYQYQSVFMPWAEAVNKALMDSAPWKPYYPDKIWDIKRQQWTYPFVFQPVPFYASIWNKIGKTSSIWIKEPKTIALFTKTAKPTATWTKEVKTSATWTKKAKTTSTWIKAVKPTETKML
jgi:hypothetical protein